MAPPQLWKYTPAAMIAAPTTYRSTLSAIPTFGFISFDSDNLGVNAPPVGDFVTLKGARNHRPSSVVKSLPTKRSTGTKSSVSTGRSSMGVPVTTSTSVTRTQ